MWATPKQDEVSVGCAVAELTVHDWVDGAENLQTVAITSCGLCIPGLYINSSV